LPFARPDIGEDELAEVRETLVAGWLTTGDKARRFEAEFAAFVGCEHAVALNSCTAALHLALEASGVGPEDEVITTPYTFAASAEVIRYLDARPVFADVERESLNLDPEAVRAAITPRTRAILPVHFAGRAADLSPLYDLARTHGLAVIEDAAHALPATYSWMPIGATSATWGIAHHAVCFSFYATKTLTTGEGGMLCTSNPDLADRCRVMSLHGISRDAWKRYRAEGSWYYEIQAAGYKYNMTDIAASLGLAQLRRVVGMWQRRSAIAAAYDAGLGRREEVELPTAAPGSQHAWHLYPLRLHLERLTIDRARFVEDLRQLNIGTSVHFIPLHLHPYYRDLYGYRPEDFPVAAQEYVREVSLPIYSAMSDHDVQDVVLAVHAVLDRNQR